MSDAVAWEVVVDGYAFQAWVGGARGVGASVFVRGTPDPAHWTVSVRHGRWGCQGIAASEGEAKDAGLRMARHLLSTEGAGR